MHISLERVPRQTARLRRRVRRDPPLVHRVAVPVHQVHRPPPVLGEGPQGAQRKGVVPGQLDLEC